MENPARYIIRASFSQGRMSYVREEAMVVYKSKDGREIPRILVLQILLQVHALISQIWVNRWLDSMVYAVTSTGVEGKGKIVTGQIYYYR